VKRVVVKIGGHAMDDLASDSATLVDLAHDVAALRADATNVIVVHGGGPQIGALLDRLGTSSSFHEGLRVTDEETMSAVAMALSLVNVQMVAAFNHAGVRAAGLCGADDGLLTSAAIGAQWGRVGGAPRVRTAIIEGLWTLGVTPIVSCIAVDDAGGLLNVNADTVAGALAVAVDADGLFLLSDVDQVRRDPDDPESVVSSLTGSEARELVESGHARDGMRPKLMAALDALDGGAKSVTLASGTQSHALRGAVRGLTATTRVVA
jgi:acetylglutamate kinase